MIRRNEIAHLPLDPRAPYIWSQGRSMAAGTQRVLYLPCRTIERRSCPGWGGILEVARRDRARLFAIRGGRTRDRSLAWLPRHRDRARGRIHAGRAAADRHVRRRDAQGRLVWRRAAGLSVGAGRPGGAA